MRNIRKKNFNQVKINNAPRGSQPPGGSGLLSNNQDIPTVYNGIRSQEAIFGTPLPILVGQQRLSWKLLWYGAFDSWQANNGGSGLIKGGQTYVYAASVLGAVCMGPCANLLSVWSASGKFAIISYTETYVVSGTYTYTPENVNFFVQDLGSAVNTSYSVTVNDYGSPGNVTYSGAQHTPLTFVVGGSPGPGEYSLANNPTIGPLTITSVNGTGVYQGTITGGDNNAYVGFNFNITGFSNSVNNVIAAQCTGSTATSLTLGVTTTAETTGSGEAVDNTPQYVYNAAQAGQTVVVNYTTYRYHIDEDELDVIPVSPTAPVIVTQYQPYFGGDTGVFYYPSGIALTDVTPATPSAAGQYNYAYGGTGGIYEFYNGSGGDGGQGIVITYIYLDPDYDPNDPTGKLNLTFYGGGLGQSVWPYLSGRFPAAALGYSEICYVASSALYLGYTPSLPQMNFEILGPYSFGGYNATTGDIITDCCPADVIYGLLTSPEYKFNFPASSIGVSLLEGNSSAKAQWVSNNFFISAILDNQTALMSVISDWCEAGQVYASWDEGQLKFIPLVDTTTVGNGLTYYPPTQPIIDLDDNDFVVEKNQDPITVEQTPWQSRWNRVSIRWAVRANDYNEDILQVQDQGAVNQYGLMAEDPKSYQFICLESSAQFAANMRLQRFSAIYTTYSFTLKSNFAFLSPGDIITITDGLLGTSGTLFGRTPCRITKMTDDPVKGIQIEAENYPWSVGTAYLYNKQAQIPSNTGDGPQEDPGNTTALIVEVPNQAAQQNGDQVFIFANGSNVNWGGFQLYVSSDGVDYRQYGGNYTSQGKIGTTTDNFPYHTDPDFSNTLTVDMQQSGATLQSISNAAWNNFTSASAIVSPGQAFDPENVATVGTAIGTTSPIGNTASQGPLTVTSAVDVPVGIGIPWSSITDVTGSSGYASVALTKVSNVLPAGVYIDGTVSAYFWDISNDPQGAYRPVYPVSTSTADASATGNSLMFNTPPSYFGGSGDPIVHPVQWATIGANGAITGFTNPYLADTGQSYNIVLLGSLYIPVAGTYTISVSHDDGLIFAISGAAIVTASDPGDGSQPVPDDPFSHTETAVMGYTFTGADKVGGINGQGFHPENYTINFPSSGTYPFEFDWVQFQGPQVLGVYTSATSSSPWTATIMTPATGNQNVSDFIQATDCGFTVPTGSNAIIGVEVGATAYANSASGTIVPNLTMGLVYQGTQLGASVNVAASTLTTSPASYNVGSLTTLSNWNLLSGTLTPDIVNDPSFGVNIQANINGTTGVSTETYIQDVGITVAWSTAGTVVGWSNPQYVSSNTSYASATFTSTQNLTQWLFASSFDFVLPFGFVLAGIEVVVNSYASNSSAAQLTAQMVSDQQRIGAPKSVIISSTPTDYTLGSSTDEWGGNSYWDLDTLNSQGLNGFGVMVQILGSYPQTVYVDNVRIILYGTSTTNLELVAFETATLVGQNTYNLTNIHRGILGSYPCVHPTGSTFAQLNQATIIYQVPSQYLGTTLYFKFLSFNAYGLQLQSIADVVPIAVPIQGLSPGAIDTETGALLTGTANFSVEKMDTAISAVHGSFGVQNIPSSYALMGPLDQISGVPQWQDITTGAGGGTNDIYLYVPKVAGTYQANQELYYAVPVRQVTLPQNLFGSTGGCRVAPTSNVTIQLLQNGSSIGNALIAANATTATFTFSNQISFNGFSDNFQVLAPATADPTLAGFWMDIQASRSN